MVGPLLFGAIASASSQRVAMLSTAAFFVLGLIGMALVDEGAGGGWRRRGSGREGRRESAGPWRMPVKCHPERSEIWGAPLDAASSGSSCGFSSAGRGRGRGAAPAGAAPGAGRQPRQRPGRSTVDPRHAAGAGALPRQEHPLEDPGLRPLLPRRSDSRLPAAGPRVDPPNNRAPISACSAAPPEPNEETFARCHEVLAGGALAPSSRRGRATASRPCSRSRPDWRGSSWRPSSGSGPWESGLSRWADLRREADVPLAGPGPGGGADRPGAGGDAVQRGGGGPGGQEAAAGADGKIDDGLGR